ncbi:MAG: 50S ribosomal protein L11 methyltransferase [Legionella sp.]|nr:MAG: 50S ribosomal protein L11 methyltransferase [Legionella sp.]
MMQQLKIEHCTQHDVELLSDLLELHGALSVTMTDQFDDPILEPEPGTVPLWPHVIMQALYEPEVDVSSIIQLIMLQYPSALCSVENVVEQEWEKTCLVDFQPQQFGQRLWICPSWHTPPEPDAVNLILDPGLAFGTGSHGTTALCLTWLEQENLKDKTMIDYGCGSGILSVAALKLGAKQVHAVDIDPQALTATESNAVINNIDGNDLKVGYPDGLHTTVDLIVANILLTPLLELKQSFHHLLNHSGVLAVSGILGSQTEQLTDAYQSYFKLRHADRDGDWALLVFEKINDHLDTYLN